MKGNWILQLLMVVCTFLVALVMEITPWSAEFQGLRPSWLVLVLLYWVLAIPNKISIGYAFVVGLIWDLSLGSILGVHALILSIFAYLIASNHLILRNLSLWLQSMLVVIAVVVIHISIFLIELFMHSADFSAQELLGAVFSGVLWPWVFLLLRTLRRKFSLR
ncbi:rod shape-determining protein MreD [Testudinibacter sp. TR-2022]|uniref:rod shape-determining protein MreD n=1 Tax=Testudinibacter sp. TR-2022 TaxID=2585029 RepID=UPI001119CB0E|nr:rod shape-determining protein MreD [Testudinibacter sp. TR-2022]TNH04693.1 rod shape-determining protein MreD [Pasteurellaceae bacterium Phil31]TNH10147.1 rod shape-determining protein MreD [Testudinibacter sp. TR-2022]TNH12504.1 rod shape-determining protein MreD [Testudinibacter sp. TR-2022]TNH15401.1 rod shape-determining protein MreD [Testudinibacter sp. TR-2022]TNH17101.1 rod shape-determining protein MreD [Testudinibacter sp. TR-2022]